MPIAIYQCRLCEEEYSDEESAIACEAIGIPKPRYPWTPGMLVMRGKAPRMIRAIVLENAGDPEPDDSDAAKPDHRWMIALAGRPGSNVTDGEWYEEAEVTPDLDVTGEKPRRARAQA